MGLSQHALPLGSPPGSRPDVPTSKGQYLERVSPGYQDPAGGLGSGAGYRDVGSSWGPHFLQPHTLLVMAPESRPPALHPGVRTVTRQSRPSSAWGWQAGLRVRVGALVRAERGPLGGNHLGPCTRSPAMLSAGLRGRPSVSPWARL